MAIFCESDAPVLKLTGVPIGLCPGESDGGQLAMNFMTVSTLDGQNIHMELEGNLGLSKEWLDTVSAISYNPNERLSFDLVRSESNQPERDLMDVLMGDNVNFYEIKAVRSEPNPMAGYI